MNIVIATCFKSNEERVNFIKNVFLSRGDNVKVISTDFDHVQHKKRTDINKKYIYLNTMEYQKNLSLNRIFSHIKFSKDLFSLIKEIRPDIVWLMIPANSLIKEAYIYNKEFKDTKLIVDIIDMWPESLPIQNIDNYIFFKTWKRIRSKYLSCAHAVVCECDYYKEILKNEYSKKITTLYWSRDQKEVNVNLILPKDKLSLVYLGSINNIIDIDTICSLIKNSKKRVVLHIIGSGENKECLINKCSEICEVIDHGEQREIEKKTEIMRCCHAGLNIYKECLYIGLTVKSIDYLQFGLPIINNIKGDTWSLINSNNVGFNVNKNYQLNYEEILKMRVNNEHIYNLYKEKFTKEKFVKQCTEIINEVTK